jgi:hypothetical protein
MTNKKGIGIFLFFGGFLCIVFRFQIGDFLLKKFGTTCHGILTNDARSAKYVKPTLLYSFKVDGDRYSGDSMIEDRSKIGDTICVGYLNILPSVNRPSEFGLFCVANTTISPLLLIGLTTGFIPQPSFLILQYCSLSFGKSFAFTSLIYC